MCKTYIINLGADFKPILISAQNDDQCKRILIKYLSKDPMYKDVVVTKNNIEEFNSACGNIKLLS